MTASTNDQGHGGPQENQGAVPDLAPAALEAAGALGGSPDPGYFWPSDPGVAAALEHWRDLKLGVIMHWGVYSFIGQGGSWSLHRGDLGWFTDPPAHWQGTDTEYHAWYYDQLRDFTGHEFDATQWAQACAQAGMRYCVFTTKHHDGVCMYDSWYTNLKSTSEQCGLRRDVLAEVCQAFRSEGLEMGAYFSKADWSRPEYWDLSRPVVDRFHNYDISQRPRAWQRFVEFTRDQIEEILDRYGPWMLLWLDAGWVREPEEPIGIEQIATRARTIQPDILIVDREVHGPFEDYRTPEQTIPETVVDHPWESCITLTREWCAMSREDPAKPTSQIVDNLVRIVARGGNYLIGIGPDATGHMPESVRNGLRELGEWMRTCGEGIYATRVPSVPVQLTGPAGTEWFLTQKTEGRETVLYAFGLGDIDHLEGTSLTVSVQLAGARMLGGGPLPIFPEGQGTRLELPASATPYAVGLALTLA